MEPEPAEARVGRLEPGPFVAVGERAIDRDAAQEKSGTVRRITRPFEGPPLGPLYGGLERASVEDSGVSSRLGQDPEWMRTRSLAVRSTCVPWPRRFFFVTVMGWARSLRGPLSATRPAGDVGLMKIGARVLRYVYHGTAPCAPPLARIPRTLLVALALTLATLGLSLLLKDSCDGPGWDGYQYRALCYNDIAPLYGAHHFDTDTFPYVDHAGDQPSYGPAPFDHEEQRWRGWVEYPVLTGLLMWVAAKSGTWLHDATGIEKSSATFLYVNAFFLALFALGTVVLLQGMAHDKRRVAYFAAGSALVLYAFHNWDLMAVFFVVLTIFWFERGRLFLSGAALSLGASAKIFPIVAAPFLFFVLVRRAFADPTHPGAARWLAAFLRALAAKRPWLLAAGTAAGFAVVNLPFVLLGSRDMWVHVFRFHLHRSPNFETVYFVAHEWGRRWHVAWMERLDQRTPLDEVLLVVLALAFLGLLVVLWRRRWGPREAAFVAVLGFLVLNKVFSVQYALWALPFFVLLPLPAWSYGIFAAADAWVYVTLFPLFNHFDDPKAFDAGFRWMSLAVLARALSFVLLVLIVVARGGAWTRRPRRARP